GLTTPAKWVVAKGRPVPSNRPRDPSTLNFVRKEPDMGLCKPILGGGSILLAACLLLPAGCGKKDDKKPGATTTGATTTGATTTGATTTGEGTHAKKGDDHILLAPSAGAHDYHVRLK